MNQHRTGPRGTGLVGLLIVVGLLTAACSSDGADEATPADQPRAGLETPQPGATASRMTNSDEVASEPRPSLPEREGSASLRARLTPEYLQGEWCGVFSQERSWYVFESDGSFQAGMGQTPDVEGTIDTLLEDFRVIVEVEADRFVLARGGRGHYRLVLDRGPC